MATTASVGEGVWVALAAAEASPAVVSAAVSVLVSLVVGSVGVSVSGGGQIKTGFTYICVRFCIWHRFWHMPFFVKGFGTLTQRLLAAEAVVGRGPGGNRSCSSSHPWECTCEDIITTTITTTIIINNNNINDNNNNNNNNKAEIQVSAVQCL